VYFKIGGREDFVSLHVKEIKNVSDDDRYTNCSDMN
jgi:hypothetical protein